MSLGKSVLPRNPHLTQNQQFIVQGLPTASRIVTRDEITVEIDTIERPDKTVVPSGRINPGTFNITLDFADNQARAEYIGWFNQCKDQGQGQAQTSGVLGFGGSGGVSPDYKKSATIVYLRLYQDSTGTDKEYKTELIGCFPKSYKLPKYDMDEAETSMLELEIQYDDVTTNVN